MENRIDQVFKEKLGELKVAPSAEAWEKVNAGLSKKNKLAIVWRVAAVLVLLGVSVGTWYFYYTSDAIPSDSLTQTVDKTKPEVRENEATTETVQESIKAVPAQDARKITRKTNKPTDQLLTKKEKITVDVEANSDKTEPIITDKEIAVEPILITQTTKPEKPIVIEFTLESFSKSPVAEVAQVKEEENTGLKKILEAARDMKNGDSDLSIIRDTKNQLLALDFRKEKTKSY